MARSAAAAAVNNAYCPPNEIAKLDVDAQVTTQLLADCYERVNRIYTRRGGDDDVAKSPKMSEALSRSLVNSYSPPKDESTVSR